MARPVDRSKTRNDYVSRSTVCRSVAYLANDLYVADLVAYSIISVTLNES